jgi:RNA polymerase sigma-70 factor (ECF subfamily)
MPMTESRKSVTFSDFYRATYPGLVAQLYAYCADPGEAQDAAQEACARAWSRWRHVSALDDPRAWVVRVGYNLVISRWRRAGAALRTMVRHGPPGPVPEPDPSLADTVAALRRLPEAQRRALTMFYLGGFSVLDIAQIEDVPEGTIKARLARGRQALAATLAPSTEVTAQ